MYECRFTGLQDPNDYSYSFNPCKPYLGEYSCTNIHVSIAIGSHYTLASSLIAMTIELTNNRSARLQIMTQPRRMTLLMLEPNRCGWTQMEHHTFTTQHQVKTRGNHLHL